MLNNYCDSQVCLHMYVSHNLYVAVTGRKESVDISNITSMLKLNIPNFVQICALNDG